MPAVAALPLFWGAVSAAAAGTAGIVGAKIASGANEKAANIASQSQSHAADLQSKAAADTLAFQKQQAAQDQTNFNSTQQANYNQWLPREQQLSSLGQLVGLPARNIPAYQQTANVFGGSQPQTGSQAAPPAQGGNLSDPNAWMSLVGNDQALSQWVAQGLGPAAAKPGLVDYYVKTIKGQPGANPTEQAGSAQFYMDLFAKDPNVTGQAPASAAKPQSGALSNYISPVMRTTAAPGLQAPSVNFGQNAAPGSLAALIGR